MTKPSSLAPTRSIQIAGQIQACRRLWSDIFLHLAKVPDSASGCSTYTIISIVCSCVHRYRLAYCELYVTLGRLFRRYDNLTTRKKQPEEMVYDDYFSAHHPVEYSQFIFKQSNQ